VGSGDRAEVFRTKFTPLWQLGPPDSSERQLTLTAAPTRQVTGRSADRWYVPDRMLFVIDLAGSHDRTSLALGVAWTRRGAIHLAAKGVRATLPLSEIRVDRARRPYFVPGHSAVYLCSRPARGSIRFTALPSTLLDREVRRANARIP
jgi:hypothetical protein